jgi:hypothetical protein
MQTIEERIHHRGTEDTEQRILREKREEKNSPQRHRGHRAEDSEGKKRREEFTTEAQRTQSRGF